MLDKLLFNNQLLSNKNKVQKAKINVINKLVQKIRKLKKLNENKSGNEKISRKLEKSTKILACIKKIKNVDLLKRAILNTKNPITIITNAESKIEEITDAMLFNHKIVLEIVKNIKILFNLNESNPGWEEEVRELSKKQKKSLKIEEKQKKRQERKSKNELERKRIEWLEENLPDSVKTIKENTSEVKMKNEKAMKDNMEKNYDWKIESVKTNQEKPINEKVKQKRKLIENQDELNQTLDEDTKCVDPFFITQTGENYLSSVQVKQVQSNENDTVNKKGSQSILSLNPKHETQKNRNSNNFKIKKAKLPNNLNNQKRRGNKTNNVNMDEDDNLHPSWKAKQKSRGIKEFKGTKIVFDDNDTKNVVKKIVENNSNSDLHPSWAAKQKMKASIKEFQGRKIVFNNEDD